MPEQDQTNKESQNLEALVAELESLAGKADFQAGTLIDLYKRYLKQPDLALPIILAGIRNVSENGEVLTNATPEHCKAILAAQKPLSSQLLAAETDLVTQSAARLVRIIRDGANPGELQHLITSKELVVSDFTDISRREQREVRMAYGKWASYSQRPYTRQGYRKPYTELPVSKVLQEVYPAAK